MFRHAFAGRLFPYLIKDLRRTSLIILNFLIFLSIPSLTSADDEKIFRDAQKYTVEIDTGIRIPFMEDVKGSFSGAGFLVDKEKGWILTNAHVASYSPSISQAAFYDHDFQPVEKIYVDPYLDLAILKAKIIPEEAVQAELECEDRPSVGHPVGAFGHPWGYSFTGTRGIISGLTAKVGGEMLQTDAPINSGNSGGPLISLKTGRIVGISTSKVDSDEDQNTNFAEQIIYACRILQILKDGGNPSPPKLNIIFQEDLENNGKLIVAKSYLGKNQLPLKEGDLIQEVLKVPGKIKNEGQFVHALRGRLENVALKIFRDGKSRIISGKLEPQNLITDRKGIFFSGALVSGNEWRDQPEVNYPLLFIHYIEEGSLAEIKGMAYAYLYSVDGMKIRTLEKLHEYLMNSQKKKKKVTFKLMKTSSSATSIFKYFEVPLEIQDLMILKH